LAASTGSCSGWGRRRGGSSSCFLSRSRRAGRRDSGQSSSCTIRPGTSRSRALGFRPMFRATASLIIIGGFGPGGTRGCSSAATTTSVSSTARGRSTRSVST
jgi:hypothetical protein